MIQNIVNNKSNALKPGTIQHKAIIRIPPKISASHIFI